METITEEQEKIEIRVWHYLKIYVGHHFSEIQDRKLV